MKRCKDCGRLLSLTDFYRHPMMGDGHLGNCKDCKKAYARQYGHGPTARAYDRGRNTDPQRVSDRGERAYRERREHPAKNRARLKVRREVRAGRLVKTPCAVCGSGDVQAHHHWGYEGENAVRVVWLCRPHHMEQHRQYDTPPLPITGSDWRVGMTGSRS